MMRIFTRARFVILFVITGIIILHSTGILRPIEGVVVAAVRPVQDRLSGWLSASRSTASNVNSADGEEEATRLLIENARLKEERQQLLARINQDSFLAESKHAGVAVTIVGRGPEGDAQILVLNRGLERGIAKGQPVIANDGVLIGTILEAEQGRSTVMLLTNSQIRVPAEVQNAQRSPGVVVGQHGLAMSMQLIPQNEEIQEKQLVVTATTDEKIPAGLIIGEITSVHFSVGDLFQEAALRPLVDFLRLRYVTVLTTP